MQPVALVRPSGFDGFPPSLALLSQDGPYRALIDRWHDGDTFDALVDCGFGLYAFLAVRVKGCNAPELATPEGKAALQFVETLLPPPAPVVLSVERDYVRSFERYVCGVTLADGRDLAAVLIAAGHAVPEAG